MSTLQHLKAQRTQVLNKFPAKTFGSDGDIVISRISGKGVFLCSKAGGMWYTANKMQELNQLGKTSISSLTVNRIKINQMIKANNSPDKFVVNDEGNLRYKTGEQVIKDLPLPFNNIAYKTAYCSLEQHSDKETCELNGGTWYYSENDSHDSISSTPENQLLTVGQSIGSVDAENTLLYDGSTFEIKYNSDYDDNWQTSAQTDLLKLSYGSKYTSLNVDSNGSLTVDSVRNITLDADGGNVYIKDADASHFVFDCTNTNMVIYDDTDTSDYLKFLVAANGASTISTNDNDGTAGNLTLQPDGDLVLDPASQKTIINATDELYFDGGTHTSISEASDDVLSFTVGGTNLVSMSEASTNSVNINNSELTIDSTKKLYLDGSVLGNTYISESSADVLDVKVGGDMIFQITESGDDGNTIDIVTACIGFTQLEPTYDATDTVVDFRHSNKQNLTFGSGSITNVKLYFPTVSGNFQLLVKQDGTGSRTITNYRVYEFDESTADGDAGVKFAGGSNPTLTTDANHVDIISFYWDADNEIAYGVATLDFQF